MSTREDIFFSPKFQGERFNDHTLPLSVMDDVSELQQFIVEVAKWQFLQMHPERVRVPKNFDSDIELKLVGLEEGSTKLVIILAHTISTLMFHPSQEYFQKAKEKIIAAVVASEKGEDSTRYLPSHLLTHFNKIGKSLHKDESIELSPDSTTGKGIINHETRKRLVNASGQKTEFLKEVEVIGRVSEVDKLKATFCFELRDGTVIKTIDIPSTFESNLLAAFSSYENLTEIRIKGIGKLSNDDKLVTFDKIESADIYDIDYINERINDLLLLEKGWFNGTDGEIYDKNDLLKFKDIFLEIFDEDMLPLIFPTPTGNIMLEWNYGSWAISLQIDYNKNVCYFDAISLDDKNSDLMIDYVADDIQSWYDIIKTIKSLKD